MISQTLVLNQGLFVFSITDSHQSIFHDRWRRQQKYLYALVASFLCPLNAMTSSFMLRTSNSLMRWSLEAVNNQLPFRFHFTSITVCLCA